MIAFENFEKTINESSNRMYRQQIDEQCDPYDVDQRYLEPVQEEYLESEIETPVEFPDVMQRNDKQSLKGQKLSKT